MLKNFTFLLPSLNGQFEEENIKKLIEMYQDDLDCSKLSAVRKIKTWQQKFIKTKVLRKIHLALFKNVMKRLSHKLLNCFKSLELF